MLVFMTLLILFFSRIYRRADRANFDRALHGYIPRRMEGDRGSTLQIANIEFSRFQQVGDLHDYTEYSLKRILQRSCSFVRLDPTAIEDFYTTFLFF
jgi:hypothetical protein